MCNVERKKRGFTNFDSCGLCSSVPETIFHALRDCPLAMRLWNQLGAEQIENNFFNTNDVFRWLASNLQNIDAQINGVSWDIVFVETKTVQVAWQRDSLHKDGLKYLSFIAWQPGGLGWITVNTDGSVNSRGGAGLAVLRLLWERGWKKIELQSDYAAAVALVQGQGQGVFRIANLLRNINSLLQ
ncbi:uncharacterized protein LOC122722092 [Manihot esculenta]|uniref:uncharacterized protein LOC122722092 n=1 Tax=Manihot esculenta TaxID=3983 RepID=UPI001CC78012|nr:uncharacterized protein LOC122722092 [Manihot esculenta]